MLTLISLCLTYNPFLCRPIADKKALEILTLARYIVYLYVVSDCVSICSQIHLNAHLCVYI